jgi:hypothetical protein
MTQTITPVTGAGIWHGPLFNIEAQALQRLTPAQLDEIDAALGNLLALGDLDLPEITPETFPLPGLASALREVQDRLRHGSGVVLLRGLERDRYDEDDLSRIYYGLSAHVGIPIAQSHRGELLTSVMDVSDAGEQREGGTQLGGRQGFHTDGVPGADIVALLCLREAKSGGASRIVSAAALHNALLERRPDLLEALYEGYVCHLAPAEAEESGKSVSDGPVPVFQHRDGEITSVLNGAQLRRAARNGAPLSLLHAEAYDELQRLADTPEFYLDMSIREGDIQFISNRILLHGRTDYEDHPELERRRHMLRIWLKADRWPAVPEPQRFFDADDTARFVHARRPRMDFPSVHLRELTDRMEAQRAAGENLQRRRAFGGASLRGMASGG